MNYYEILEISKSATLEVIKAAYKAQISKYHPDNLETGDLKKAQQINEAYEVLSDPVKRAEYDKKIALDEGNDIKNGDGVVERDLERESRIDLFQCFPDVGDSFL